MIYLLDTDTLILYMRGLSLDRPRGAGQIRVRESGLRVADAGRQAAQKGADIALSAITRAELAFGVLQARDVEAEEERLARVLAPFTVLDFDGAGCARHYGQVRKNLEDQGRVIGPLDLLIAAHALELDATLVTNNVREFTRVPGLRVVNWSV